MSDHKGDTPSLFAKVIKFVRSPSTSWAGIEVPEETPESGYSKQMLKEMIERKRRNDFVRRREFDVLRKLRRNEVIAGHDAAARPSFFHSSMPSRPDDRASTLKKIDEIEAQMSQQWWKTKSADPTSTDGLNSLSTPVGTPLPLPRSSGPLAAPETPAGDGIGAAMAVPSLNARQSTHVPLFADQPWSFDTQPPEASGAGVTGATGAVAPSEPVKEFEHDALLEDAAIRFAHGDDEGAESALRDLLQPGGPRQHHADTWLALFDLYRATGQQDRFDDAAVDFASQFGRSAPQWVSLPQLASRPPPVAAGGQGQGQGQAQRQPDWTCPAVLGPQSLSALQASLARATAPWRLSWSRLSRIDDAAVEPLTRVLGQWAAQTVRMQFTGADRLDSLLRQNTVSGDSGGSPAWWKLRMEMLRLMHRADEFELVALDYCVTFEVSPPSWDAPRCQVRSVTADGSDAGIISTLSGEAYGDSIASVMPASGFGDTFASTRLPRPVRGELSGFLEGDAAAALDRLSHVLPGELLTISCGRLLRVDFGAAGSLLNWSTARQSEGCTLQFTDVHRLIAPFFGVVGIPAAARILIRRD